jgi:hypothetical protein
MVILFASFIGFLLFIEISLLTSPVDEIMAIVLAFLTYAIGFFSLMIHFLEEQTVSARATSTSESSGSSSLLSLHASAGKRLPRSPATL